MADSLGSIQRTLAQIRWIAIGAAVALTAKEMNLMSLLTFVGHLSPLEAPPARTAGLGAFLYLHTRKGLQ